MNFLSLFFHLIKPVRVFYVIKSSNYSDDDCVDDDGKVVFDEQNMENSLSRDDVDNNNKSNVSERC